MLHRWGDAPSAQFALGRVDWSEATGVCNSMAVKDKTDGQHRALSLFDGGPGTWLLPEPET